MSISETTQIESERNDSSWLAVAKRNLLPKSQSQDFKIALVEWSYEPPPIDHEIAEERCELCDHENLRWHFQIMNRLTKNQLLVGSVCILRFSGIKVHDDDGRILTKIAERKAKLHADLRKLRVEKMLTVLRRLYTFLSSQPEEQNQLESIANRFKNKGGFSVKELLWLFRKLEKAGLKADKSLFDVRLRAHRDQNKLVTLDDEGFLLIQDCLSPQQLKRFARPHLSKEVLN